MRLTVLGSATPFPRPDQPCSGYLLESEQTTLWIDAGPGTLPEVLRLRSLDAVDVLWVSHRHADHSAELLPLYYALRYGPEAPLRIPLFAPDGLHERVANFVGPHAEQKVAEAFPPVVMSGFGEVQVRDMTLSWAPVQHGVPAFALRVESGGSSFAYSGDCAPCGSLEDIAELADLFVCEVGYSRSPAEGAVHHTPEQAGTSATRAGARRLALTHLDSALAAKEAVSRAQTTFGGEVLTLMPRTEYTV